MINKERSFIRLYFAIAGLFSVYAALFIYQTSFEVNGIRYFTLFDDAMISMRYARNLVLEHGLVYNIGERVEGFTNPLWVLFMAILHLLPVPQAKISILVQITGGMLHIATLWYVMKIARKISRDSFTVTAGALIVTAFYLPLVNWSLQGMEVSLAAFLVTFAAFRTVVLLEDGVFSPVVFIILGIATLVRIDCAIPFVATWLFLLVFQSAHRNQTALWGFSVLASFLCFQTLLRYAYYGDILPATYYLKMTGYPAFLRITRGAAVFWQFIWGMLPVTFFIPIVALGKEYTRSRGLLAWLFAVQCAYSIYVGGDAWEMFGGSNRYISTAMPLFAILFTAGLDRLVRVLLHIPFPHNDTLKKHPGLGYTSVFSILLFVFILLLNNNRGPLSLRGMAFRVPTMHKQEKSQMVWFSDVIENITTPDASIAVTWAGTLPYFSDRPIVDILGKTDHYLSRIPMKQSTGQNKLMFFYPGHLKFDYKYSLGEKKPDVVFQLWSDPEEARLYIESAYTQVGIQRLAFFVRTGSPHIRWEMIRSAPVQNQN
jgi:arabinofuranosyltransferase